MAKLEQLLCKKDGFERSSIEVKPSSIHHYGVFATKDFSPGDLIEECPVIIFQCTEPDCCKEILNKKFNWDNTNAAIALGYGSLYNHADEPNASFTQDYDNQIMKFKATKYIIAGTEILINYGDNWFAFRNVEPLTIEQQQRKNDSKLLKIVILLFVLLIISMIFPINTSTNTQPFVRSKEGVVNGLYEHLQKFWPIKNLISVKWKQQSQNPAQSQK